MLCLLALIGKSQELPYHPDRIIVWTKSENSRGLNQLQQARILYGTSRTTTFTHSTAEVWCLPSRTDVDRMLEDRIPYWTERIQREFSALYVQPDYRYHSSAIPNDSLFHHQWSLRESGPSCSLGKKWGITDFWNQNTHAEDVIVGILDTGIDWTHEDLGGNIWQNLGEDIDGDGQTIQWNAEEGRWEFDPDDLDGLDSDGNSFSDDLIGYDFMDGDHNPMDALGHGTHVAGILGAVGNNGTGISGICWKVKMMPLRFLDSTGNGYSSTAVDALHYAIMMGAHITNNSWGGKIEDEFLKDAILRAEEVGQVFVAAAGNDYGNNNDLSPVYPASYPFEHIVSVGASDCEDNLLDLSNYGAGSVDMMAPGYGILSTLPNNNYGHLSGTSMAAPFVTAAISLLKGVCKDSSMLMLKDYLLEHAEVVENFVGLSTTEGRIRMPESLPCQLPIPIQQTSFDMGGEERANFILETFQGDWIVGGSRQDNHNAPLNAAWIHLDENGDIQGLREYETALLSEELVTGVELSDSTYIVGGYVSGGAGMTLIRVQADGDTLWSKSLGAVTDKCVKLIESKFSNEVILLGTSIDSETPYWVIGRMSFGGFISWSSVFFGAIARDIIEDKEGNLVILGEHKNGDFYNAYLAKINPQGELLWEKSLGNVGTDKASAIELTQDGGYIFTGNSHSGIFDMPVHPLYVLKTDSDGNTQWAMIYGDEGIEESTDIISTPDNHFLIIGHTSSNVWGTQNGYVMKIDADGQLIWAKQYGGDDDEIFREGIRSKDGGYLMTGYTASSTENMYVVKINERGESGCDEMNWQPNAKLVQWGMEEVENTLSSATLASRDFIWSSTPDAVSFIPQPACIDPGCGISARFINTEGRVCLEDETVFENRSSGGDSLRWYINDSLVSAGGENTFAYIFENPGIVKITLEVMDSTCQASISQFINIPPPLELELGPDIELCAKTVILDAGVNASSYEWKYVDRDSIVGRNERLRVRETGLYELRITDRCGAEFSDRIFVDLFDGSNCVWPADVDGNGQIDVLDHQLLGRYHNFTGVERPNRSTLFIGQACDDWQDFMSNHALPVDPFHNVKHADVNGDGRTNIFEDGPIIESNIQNPYEITSPQGGDISLHLVTGKDSLTFGDTLEFDIILNKENGIIPQIHGMVFTLYTTISPSRKMELSVNGWMGSESDVHGITYNHRSKKRIDVSITRLRGNSISGRGRVARGGIVILIDDLEDPRTQSNQVFFSLGWDNLLLLDRDGNRIPVNSVSSQSSLTVRYELPWKEVAASAILEGAFDKSSGLMSTKLNEKGLLPHTAPMDSTLTLASLPDQMVDWVELQLHQTILPGLLEMKESRPAILLSNGSIVDPITLGPVRFLAPEDEYFLVLKHRNHLSVLGSDPIELRQDKVAAYDFRTGITQAAGKVPLTEVNTGIWALHAGDVDSDDMIYYSGRYFGQYSDRSLMLKKIRALGNHPEEDYYTEDINLDGKIDYDGPYSDGELLYRKFMPLGFLESIRSEIREE